jgi:hypothetical protein
MFDFIFMTVCYAITHVLTRPKSQAMRINIVFKNRELQIVNLRLLRCSCKALVNNYAHCSVLSPFGQFRPAVRTDKSKLMLSSSVCFSKIRVYLHDDKLLSFLKNESHLDYTSRFDFKDNVNVSSICQKR